MQEVQKDMTHEHTYEQQLKQLNSQITYLLEGSSCNGVLLHAKE